MELTDFSRIEKVIDTQLLKNTHVVCTGTGGSFSLLEGLTRSGLGMLTCLDIDGVEPTNITRQGFQWSQIGMPKVVALEAHLATINSGLIYNGMSDNFLFWDDARLDKVFGSADIIIAATDSFKAQSIGVMNLQLNTKSQQFGWAITLYLNVLKLSFLYHNQLAALDAQLVHGIQCKII